MMECIILCGGLGTRLAHVVADVPKSMAPIGDRPFLSYIMDDLIAKGVRRFVLAVGFKKENILDRYGSDYKGVPIDYSAEESPLGTGGAIKRALDLCQDTHVFIVNGDTFFDVDLQLMSNAMQNNRFDMMIAVKQFANFDRYGTVSIDNGVVVKFHEKAATKKGFINGGVYLIGRQLKERLPEGRFSFERDFMEQQTEDIRIGAFPSDGYFIDIGVPEDYHRACTDLRDVF
jgi:D-glycero-alpha-D-manno-heptose 1-phosphate guanylyltransferase